MQKSSGRRSTSNALGDAIVMRERDKSRAQRLKRQGRIEDIDVGDLLVDGAELIWRLIGSRK